MHPAKLITLLLLLGTLGFTTSSCFRRPTPEPLSEDGKQQLDSSLTLEDVTLEQANEAGEIVWKVSAERAKYNQESKTAEITKPEGEFFQDGEVIYIVTAKQGTIQREAEQIFLRGDIVAIDVRTDAVIKANELEWRPNEALLLARNQLSGTHEQFEISAREARVFTKEQRMELEGKVKAKKKTQAKDDPTILLAAEQLDWYVEEDRIHSDRPLKFQQYEKETLTGTADANSGEYLIEEEIAKLAQSVQIDLTDPPIQIKTDSMVWDIAQESIASEQPLDVFHRAENIRVQANQGRMDLAKEIIYLIRNVQVTAQRNQARLSADEITWYMPDEEVRAVGNVVYRQSDPVLNLKGPQAIGRLKNQTVVIDGGRVVTEIIPPE